MTDKQIEDEKRYLEAKDNIRESIISFGTSFNWADDPIQRKAMEDFVERLKVKEIERLKNKAKFYYNLAKSYMCDVIYDEELEEEHEKWRTLDLK